MIEQYKLSSLDEIAENANELVDFLKTEYPKTFEYDVDYLVGGTLRMAKYILAKKAVKKDIDLIVPQKTVDSVILNSVKGGEPCHMNYFDGIAIYALATSVSRKVKTYEDAYARQLEHLRTKVDMFTLKNFEDNAFIKNASIEDYVNETTYNIEGLAWDIKNKKLHASKLYDVDKLIKQSNFGDTLITRERGRNYLGIYSLVADERTKTFLSEKRTEITENFKCE